MSIQAGTAYLAPRREENEEELMRSFQDEIDVGALTPVPRERSPLPTYDSSTGITLLIPVPDFTQMAYVSIDDMMAVAWVSPAVVALKPPVAVATTRSKRAEGFQFVTHERTTDNKYVVPPPSTYVRYQESLPTVPDSLLQDY